MSKAAAKRGWVRYALQLAVVGVLFATAGIVWFNRQYVADQITAWNYEPTPKMAAIRDDLELTSTGQRYFNASQPVIEQAQSFNRYCNQHGESKNPILGCYVDYRIYVYDVRNDKLDGIEQTTAAHELLHAAYARLSQAEKDELKPLLLTAYKSVKSPELEERVEYYKTHEPGEVVNELHSILGTEFSDLGPKLDDYYDDYFKHRGTIVAYHTRYESVFDSLQAKAESLLKQIKQLVASINTQIKQYNAAVKQLNADVADFKRRNDNGQFHSAAEFYAERNALTARSQALEAQRREIQADRATYDRLRKQYNNIATETNELNQSINSTLAPAQSLQS